MAMPLRERGPYTRDHLQHTPDDGRRYELVDGELFVSAAPAARHQLAAFKLAMLLHSAAPSGIMVLPGPFAVALAADTELQPDIVVGRVEDYTEREITRPLLAVEVLSPSTRLYDLKTKFRRLERSRIPSYWVVDPVVRTAEASLTAWEMTDHGYRQVARVVGDEVAHLTQPFPVAVVPAELVTAP